MGALMNDILIEHGIVITMDEDRRVLDDGAVAIKDGTIVAVGDAAAIAKTHPAKRRIDARRKVVMPGLIDGHAHAGHGLVKTLGGGDGDAWYKAVGQIYTTGSTPGFWRAEAALSALERLKAGVTTGLSLLGGGDSVMRTDEAVYGDAYCEATAKVGIRASMAVGPSRGPMTYARIEDAKRSERTITFDDQMAVSRDLFRRHHAKGDGRIRLSVNYPVIRGAVSDKEIGQRREEMSAIIALAREFDSFVTQDGHLTGSIKLQHDKLGLSGPRALFSHCIDLTEEEIALVAETGTRIVHNPSANMSVKGRCPVPELITAGANVQIGSDGTAPDRSYDMFRHMFQCMHYHKTHFHDTRWMPAGKVLEMVTIDAARGLGMDKDIGSLEPGKRADVILIDMAKPHLYPLNMPLYRVAYFASAADVDTVMVDGEILMEGRRVARVNEGDILDAAQQETEAMLDRTGLRHLTATPKNFWRSASY